MSSEGEPFEFIDPVSARFTANGNKTVDYFWPVCEDYQWVVFNGASCAGMVERKIAAPAYNTIEAAVFYPTYSSSAPTYAFPGSFQGGLFYTLHGSWHENASPASTLRPPRVVFVPMSGDNPVNAQVWNGCRYARRHSVLDVGHVGRQSRRVPRRIPRPDYRQSVRTADGHRGRAGRKPLHRRRSRRQHFPHSSRNRTGGRAGAPSEISGLPTLMCSLDRSGGGGAPGTQGFQT